MCIMEEKTFAEKDVYNTDDLMSIMKILRSENGCSWDRAQTHESLRKNLIEETYEVCEAIDRGDPTLLCEELGDLLLQVIFHSEIADEEGLFSFADVANDICKKMISRHPHVFGNVVFATADEQSDSWDRIKMQSKHQTAPSEALDSVARTLPSLMRAQKLARKIKKFGLDERSAQLSELLPENIGQAPVGDSEIGDRLFRIAAECEFAGSDAEKALYDTCEKVVDESAKTCKSC